MDISLSRTKIFAFIRKNADVFRLFSAKNFGFGVLRLKFTYVRTVCWNSHHSCFRYRCQFSSFYCLTNKSFKFLSFRDFFLHLHLPLPPSLSLSLWIDLKAWWPDWANFRLVGNCLLLVILVEINEVQQRNGLLFAELKVGYYFCTRNWIGLHFGRF
jgi:hypothetical protein